MVRYSGDDTQFTKPQNHYLGISRVGKKTEITIQWEIPTFWIIVISHQNKSQCFKAFYGVKGLKCFVLETLM